MEYVYLVYDEWYDIYGEPDFYNMDVWGWEEDIWWLGYEVYY